MRAVLPTALIAAFLTAGGVTAFNGGINAAGGADSSPAGSTAVSTKGARLQLIPTSSPQTGEHVSNLAHVGTRVTAVGLGFHPGARVRIIHALAETGYFPKPIAQAVVGPRGRFETSFTVTRAIVQGGQDAASGRYPGPIQPLLIAAYEGASSRVGPHHAHAVAALVIYSQ